ncbi:hypothetical protein [Microbacterium oleivorans]|uniref:hypothetical protein n=1 Tax=Microbacterium oleivorans TaxID=273677 RepID=UPI00204221A3|nr:hypothetical protein [Microbacterium oleivorans]MCM3695205.1 hypothetical protein [Microbacterium oleivorans]
MTIIRNEDGCRTVVEPRSARADCARCVVSPRSTARARANPDCHEIWEFEGHESTPVQRLAGVIALCGACHETQHSRLAELNDRWESVIATLCRVTGWDRADAEADIERSRERYRDLSNTEWDLDLTLLKGWVMLDGYPNLLTAFEDRASLGNALDRTERKLSLVVAEIPDVIWG